MKYHNTKCEYDGHKFDSKKERDYYKVLVELEKMGEITGLELQKEFELVPRQTNDKGKFLFHPITYVCDFYYFDSEGNEHIVDVKSPATEKDKVFQLKRKLFHFFYKKNIEIRK